MVPFTKEYNNCSDILENWNVCICDGFNMVLCTERDLISQNEGAALPVQLNLASPQSTRGTKPDQILISLPIARDERTSRTYSQKLSNNWVASWAEL